MHGGLVIDLHVNGVNTDPYKRTT